MSGFVKVYGNILDSSVWVEPADVRIVWITLLVMAVFPKSLDEYVGTPEASPLVILTTAVLLGVIGVIAGWFPARRASLLDPVVALKLS